MVVPERKHLVAAGLVIIVVVLALAGCGGKKKAATTTTSAVTKGGCTVVPEPKLGPNKQPKPTALLDTSKTYDVTFKTNCGSFTVKIDQGQSPHAAASFVTLVQRGFFNDTIFHRIAVGFVIQGGDPTGRGDGGPGYSTVDKPPATATYTHGVVAMAKTESQPAGTAGSQFFVVTTANAGLPADYAIIGTVIRGLDVVDRIGKHGDASQVSTMVIEIEHASVKVS